MPHNAIQWSKSTRRLPARIRPEDVLCKLQVVTYNLVICLFNCETHSIDGALEAIDEWRLQ